MIKHRTIIILLFIIVLLFSFSCKRNQKAPAYTTTLEGIAIRVPSLTGGVINQLLVTEGKWIEAGDTLAILDTRELSYQADQTDASLQELAMQSAVAQNNLKQATQDLVYVQERQQRTQRLLDAATVSQQSLDDLNNLLQKSRTQVNNAASQSEMLQATAVKLQAQKKILLKKIADAIILSPATGQVTTLYYRQGEALAPYAGLLELVNTRSLEATIFVPESALAGIKIGQKAKVITESGQQFPAVIDHISNRAEFTPKTILTKDTRAAMVYAVTMHVENPRDELKDGMPVEVELP
jgi:HlyD family secretion protein